MIIGTRDFGDGGAETWSAWTYKAGDLAAFASEPGAGEISFGFNKWYL